MSSINFEEANKMRAGGMTYEAIANYYGVTKQYVHAFMNNPAFAGRRKRKNAEVYKDPYYYGFVKMFNDDEELTIPKLSEAVIGYRNRGFESRLTRLLKGIDAHLTVNQINGLLEISGLSYEQFFKKA